MGPRSTERATKRRRAVAGPPSRGRDVRFDSGDHHPQGMNEPWSYDGVSDGTNTF